MTDIVGFSEHLLRELAPQVLGAVVRKQGDFAAAEDAVQEALIVAASKWPHEGVPDNPRAWLIQVAHRRLLDNVRAEAARRRRETDLLAEEQDAHLPAPDSDHEPEREDTLLLLFMCCHPALTRSSAVALTLRAVGGLTTAEIARAFLVPEATMAQRISRAKQLIKKSGESFRMPSALERDERLEAVLHVLYLIFNEGYTSSGSSLARVDLSSEAIRLTRAVQQLLPEDAEVAGLLALMLLTDARRAARSDAEGELIPLDRQDRSLWDQQAIQFGVELISRTLSRGEIGSYQLQAAIAALHDEAARAEDTDWPQILGLYGLLLRITENNPMVRLNHAVAAAMVQGPNAGLALLAPLAEDPRTANHHRLFAVRAHLLERAGDLAAAVRDYHAAAERTTSTPERNYLLLSAKRCRH